MKNIPELRTIYDNYDLDKNYPDDYLKETAIDCGWVDSEEEITEDDLWRWRYGEDELDWECEKKRLTDFFHGKTVGFFGEVGRWDGVFKTGKIGEFWNLFDKATTDCAYVRLYDENGHFYLTCSHHDGTCHFEVKEITGEGEAYLARWEEDWNDQRSEQHVHNQIYKRYSKIPEFAHKVYGAKRKAYQNQSRQAFVQILNNQARSFYCA